jgi:hypothetical protein
MEILENEVDAGPAGQNVLAYCELRAKRPQLVHPVCQLRHGDASHSKKGHSGLASEHQLLSASSRRSDSRF